MSSDSYTIRPPQNSSEWEVVKKLLLDYRHEFDDDTCFTSFEEELADIENLYAKDDHLKLIAISQSDAGVVGCVAYRTYSPGIAEMKRLYVVPAHRGFRLGRLLAEAIIDRAIEAGYNEMILDTMIEMKSAQQLYFKLGFEVIPSYNEQDTEKVICFSKALTLVGEDDEEMS